MAAGGGGGGGGLRGELSDARFSFSDPIIKYGDGAQGAVYAGSYTGEDGAKVPAALKVVVEDGGVFDEIVLSLDLPEHANVAKLYGFARRVEAGNVVLVMEALTGGDLRKVQTVRPLAKAGLCLELCIHVAKGLAHMHAHGVVHGDLKPENVVRDGAGIAKIVDLGLAKAAAARKDEDFYGTLPYAAPELFPGAGFTGRSKAADVWAFGVLLYALFTGRPPFDAEIKGAYTTKARAHEAVLVEKVGAMLRGGARPSLTADLSAASTARGEAPPPEFEALVKECWAVNPETRPSMANAVERLRGMRDKWRPLGLPTSLPLGFGAGGGGTTTTAITTSSASAIQRLHSLDDALSLRDSSTKAQVQLSRLVDCQWHENPGTGVPAESMKMLGPFAMLMHPGALMSTMYKLDHLALGPSPGSPAWTAGLREGDRFVGGTTPTGIWGPRVWSRRHNSPHSGSVGDFSHRWPDGSEGLAKFLSDFTVGSTMVVLRGTEAYRFTLPVNGPALGLRVTPVKFSL